MTLTNPRSRPPVPTDVQQDAPHKAPRTPRPAWTMRRVRSATATASYHLFSGVLAAVFLMPLIWVALNSIKSSQEANQQPPTWFPQSFSLENYKKLAGFGEGIWLYLANSFTLCALVVAGNVIVTVLAGYAFARFEFRGKKLLFGSTLLILMVPYATILLPLYIVLNMVGIANTVFGVALVLIMLQLPFGVFLMRNSFESIPRELEEAALVDGCGDFGAFRHVSLRLVTPAIVTVGLFAFIASWNEFLAPLIFLNDGAQYTLPIALVSMQSGAYGVVDYGALQAGVVFAVLPVLLVYLALQRYYVTGLVGGALRG